MTTSIRKVLVSTLTATACLQLSAASFADQQILDDLIVDGSVCVGQDCVNGESFGFDTLRLKENNLRIKAQDTSSSASFPTNDWQITFNDSSNGGANKFSIDDIDGGKTPFTLEAGAPSHSLYVDDAGRIGLGTSTPVVDIHVKSGNTPTLRLEQDGSSGFSAQTWDLAGNEVNFFIRDATNGSRLPFRIEPAAPSNALYVDSTGNVGLATNSPTGPLHIKHAGVGKLLMQDSGSETWALANASSEPGSAGFRISRQGTGIIEFVVLDNGDATLAGTLTQLSDKDSKTNVAAADDAKTLEKLMKLDVSEWSYKDDTSSRHFGPMAQDFYALFGLGINEKGLSALDTSGIALSAIRGMKIEKDTEVASLRADNEALKRELDSLKKTIEQLVQ